MLARAVLKRRREFTTARACARTALAELGFPPAPILSGEKHEPLWPAGVVGSITHCAGYRAAAVAFDTVVASIGVDAEPDEPLPLGVLSSIALPGEADRVAGLLRAYPATRWDRMLFSAKESVYKAWFPLTRRWLDFTEADVVIDPDRGTFSARLLVPGPELPSGRLDRFDGRWLADGGLVVTAIVLGGGG